MSDFKIGYSKWVIGKSKNLQLLTALANGSRVVIAFTDQLIASVTNISAAVTMDGEVSFEGIVFFEEALNSRHVVAEIFDWEQLLLLADPCLFFFNFSKELLVS